MHKNKETGSAKNSRREMNFRHLGRGSQIMIYLGKLLRMFIYQSDWKVLPMSALIAGLVGLVIRKKMFLNMEGTITGAFALVCVCIWNGCFNSIQVICRERDVIKREHRSGLHISAYIIAHMLYQAMICLLQTGITLFVVKQTGVQFPEEGLFTPWLIVDLGISMVLITYASDMLSLWVSTLARTSTTAMTIMPFVLIFQLVFSGAMLNLPAWTKPISKFTISGPALKVVAAQADTNNLPFVTVSGLIGKLRDNQINMDVTVNKVLGLLEAVDNENLREAVQKLKEEPAVQEIGEEGMPVSVSVGEVLDAFGEEKVKAYIEEAASAANYKPEYENDKDIIIGYWMWLLLFTFVYALLAMITLEFIDKDKR